MKSEKGKVKNVDETTMPTAANNGGSAPEIEGRTFEFALRIVKVCLVLDAQPGVRRTLSNQLLRSGTSVGANVTEAQAAQSRADFISKMNIALKEAREALYWLRLITAAKLLPEGQLAAIIQEADEIARVIGAIVRSARRNLEGG
jgi:four helix bundle protein